MYELFPNARFICLYRHCFDVVRSAIEVSKYGLFGYGLEEYLRRFPANTVQGLTDYWLDKTALILDFEREHSDQT